MMSTMSDPVGIRLPDAADDAAFPDPGPCGEIQAEIDQRLLALVDLLRARIAVVAADVGLTPQQAILLRQLGQPRAMCEVAAILACDRSNVTGLVGRLEDRGLVERTSDPHDRRVKRLRLTAAGAATAAAVQARMFADSPSTADLDAEERRRLLALLRKLTPDLPEAAASASCPVQPAGTNAG